MKKILFFICICNSLFANYATCILKGQLGNQLFEIAATVAYALDHNLTPVFPSIIKGSDIIEPKGGLENYMNIFPSIDATNPSIRYVYIREQKEHFYTPIKFIKNKNICLRGFFQSEKYFIHHEETIRKLFAPSEEVKNFIKEKWGHLLEKNCVAIHLRTFHADHLTWHAQQRLAGGVDYLINYFYRAIEHFPEDTQFLVFSDDIDWCKKNLKEFRTEKFTFINNNPRHIDFYLMSFCKHQIISPDSTFSWWAAWLNNNPEKIVIAPNVNFSTDDLDFIPSSWKKI